MFTAQDGDAATADVRCVARRDRRPAARRRRRPADASPTTARTGYAAVNYDEPAEDLGTAARSGSSPRPTRCRGVRRRVRRRGDRRLRTGGFPIGEVARRSSIAVVLLIVVLRSLRAAGNALLAAFAGIGLGFGLLLWASTLTEVPGLAPTLAGMLGLGAGIDYALLLAARQQEELRAGHAPARGGPPRERDRGPRRADRCGHRARLDRRSDRHRDPVRRPHRRRRRASSCSPRAITCVVLAARRGSPRPGAGCCRAVSAARRPCRQRPRPTRVRAPWATSGRGSRCSPARRSPPRWPRPAAGLELGQPDDRNLGTEATQRQAYDRLAAGFGPGVNGPLVVAVAARRRRPAAPRSSSASRADREVAGVAEPVRQRGRRRRRHHRHAEARAAGRPHARARRPAARRRDPRATGAEAYVGGRTARYGDEADRIASPHPAVRRDGRRAVAAAPARRVPLVARRAALRRCSTSPRSPPPTASIALAFQTQTGASLLGVEQLPVVPYVPLFMFAILFGLSTDYNVFLLSRVREEWGRHRDHRAAIAAASSGTRRIITAAGAIMVAVFLGFATDPIR